LNSGVFLVFGDFSVGVSQSIRFFIPINIWVSR